MDYDDMNLDELQSLVNELCFEAQYYAPVDSDPCDHCRGFYPCSVLRERLFAFLRGDK